MSSFDLISMAIRNLLKRKLRTVLTVLGVVIGTASIVVMISIGIGMNESYRMQVEQMGSLQVITVSPVGEGGMYYSMSDASVSASSSQNNKGKNVVLNLEAFEKFRAIEGVEAVTPVVRNYMMLISGKYVADASFIGIYPETMEAMGYGVTEGRSLEEADKNVVVVGEDVISSFYNPKQMGYRRYGSDSVNIDIFNDKLQLTYDWGYGTNYANKSIKPIRVEAVGKMASGGENGYNVIMPIKTLESIIKQKEEYQNKNSGVSNPQRKKSGVYDSAAVKVSNMNDVKRVQEQIKDMGYSASSLNDYLESMKETTKMLRMMLGAIGAISLIVAAIGITNTMVMSIYERTREIGVMKVIGASLSDIRRLFLTEAAFIGFAGGVFGVFISFAASKLVNYFAAAQGSNMLSSIPIWLYLGSLAFSTLVGIVSGYFPAKRAMRLSALEAIKTE